VICGGVGAGVAGAQDGGQGLAAAGLAAQQRVEAIAALVVAGGALLVGVGRDKRGVDVQDEAPGGARQAPGAGAGGAASLAQAGQHPFVETLQTAVGGGIRGDLAEQYALVSERSQVGQAVAAVGQHHGQVAHHPAGLVADRAGEDAQRRNEAVAEPQSVGQSAEQRRAGARGQGGLCGAHFNAQRRRGSVHLHGDPPESGLGASQLLLSLLRGSPSPLWGADVRFFVKNPG
jgi:hypothetical protein